MLDSRRVGRMLVGLSFLVVAALQAWPLPLSLSQSFTGHPGGDTGVYVWNQWVFRHEFIDRHSSPFQTESILSLPGPADLSLHNYTVFADLVALPLQPWLGVVATFNVVYLLNVALAGFGVYLLALRFRDRIRIGHFEAWLAGVLFACSPFLVARSTAHFSLAAAAPLPFFVLCFDRAWQTGRARDAALTGACFAWAAFSDPYYAVYCVILGLCLIAGRLIEVSRAPSRPRGRMRFAIDGLIAAGVVAIAIVRLARIEAFAIAGQTVSVRSLYTPVLLLTLLVVLRVAMSYRPQVTWHRPAMAGRLIGLGAIAAATGAVLTAPELYAIAMRAVEGRLVTAPVLWRSSAPGVDLLSFFAPNPNHPLAPASLVSWLSGEPGRYEENVMSVPWVALGVIALAWRGRGSAPSKFWLALAVGAASLAVGPFLRVAGVETYIPTPWTFLRYVPVIGDARMPARFGVLVILAVAMLFASALTCLGERHADRRRTLAWCVGLLLAFELLPVPRTLYSASIPKVYDIIAQDPRPVRVLNLPFGIRDGLSSIGNFTAAYQFYQTRHGKALIGGYLSRVSQARKDFHLNHPYLIALFRKSEGQSLDPVTREAAQAAAAEFVEVSALGYVVIDEGRVTPALRAFVIETLRLRPIGEDGTFRLYVPEGR